MIICTSICSNYLPKAMVLAKSVKEKNEDVRFLLCLTEREIPQIAKDFEYFDYIVLSKDLGFEDFDRFIFKHSIVEASTAVKGDIFKYMFKTFPLEKKFVYLDPDIKVYGELKELKEALDLNEIVLTPHLTIQEEELEAVMDNELCALQHGVFNLGFLAVSKGEESVKFINWWANRLGMFCYDDIPKGIFTDQKWIDLAPCFFNTFILKHPGYNIAPWNLSKRKVNKVGDSEYEVNKQELRFFHYSGFDSGANEAMINKYVPDKNNIIYKLRDEYVTELLEMGQEELGKIKWSYDYYSSGEKIDRISRLIYRDNMNIKNKYGNPFDQCNEVFVRDIRENEDGENVKLDSVYSRIKQLENEILAMRNTTGWKMLENIRKSNPALVNLAKKVIKK